jgi:hypothetical protein
MGTQYQCFSSDQGMTWTRPEPSALEGPLSPASIKRDPFSKKLIALHNDHSGAFPFRSGWRAPLVLLVSVDEAQSWSPVVSVEKSITGWYCYTSMLFVRTGLYLSYIAGNKKIGLLSRQKVVFIPSKELP